MAPMAEIVDLVDIDILFAVRYSIPAYMVYSRSFVYLG